MRTETKDDILFTEVQRIRQPWVWVVVILVHLSISIPLFFISSQDNLWATGISWLFFILLTLFLAILRLKVVVTTVGIHLQFFPFHLSPVFFPWSAIQAVWAGSYAPLREFGGWGYRMNFSGNAIAWSVYGNKGVKILLTNGKKRLIGTQDAEGWNRALQLLGKTKEISAPPF